MQLLWIGRALRAAPGRHVIGHRESLTPLTTPAMEASSLLGWVEGSWRGRRRRQLPANRERVRAWNWHCHRFLFPLCGALSTSGSDPT